MKKALLFCLFVIGGFSSVYAQQNDLRPIALEVKNRIESGEKMIPISPFKKPIPVKQLDLPEILPSSAWAMELDLELSKSLIERQPEMIDLILPNPFGKEIHLTLYKKDPGLPGSIISFSDGRPSIPLPGVHYRGIVKDNVNSLASISFFDGEIVGLIADDNGNYNLGKIESSQGKNLHVIYNDKSMNLDHQFNCGLEDDDGSKMDTRPNVAKSRAMGDCVKLYWEADNDLFIAKGGLAGTTSFMTALGTQTNVMFFNEGITTYTNEIKIWNTPSPYTGSNTSQRLNSFKINNGVLNGDLAHLVDNQNIGGQAAGFNGLCNTSYDESMCYSSLANLPVNNVPTYSWPVNICTHELGHLFGSRHTHACVWNGNNTAIDGCSGFVEGSCALPPHPPGGGTVMSYCHNSPVGVNLALGFGPQPSVVINNSVNNSNCLSASCAGCSTCPATGFSLTITGCNNNNTCISTDDFYPASGTVTHQSCASQTGDGQFTIVYNPGSGQIIFGPFTYSAGTSSPFNINIPYGATTGTIINLVDNDFPCTLNGSINVNPSPLPGCSSTTAPIVTCPPNVTLGCGQSTQPSNTGTATAINCSGATIPVTFTDVTVPGSCPQNFTIQRTWSATDGTATGTCLQLISVLDIVPPTINSCAAAQTVSCANLVPAPNTSLISASDACGGPVTISFVNDAISNQTCANRYTITRTYRATDQCNNSSTCSQIITVNDVTPPTITCPATQTVTCANLVPAPNTSLVSASDACGGQVLISFVGDAISSQTCVNRYTITRTYRATDVCGNSATCAQTIIVNDVNPPTITCPANLSFECSSAIPAPNTSGVSASDNCGGVPTVSFVSDLISSQTCANRYTLMRTYRATDVCGNSATCVQSILVNDLTPPVLSAVPNNVTIECTQTPPPPANVTGTDNCGGSVTVTFKETSTKSNYLNSCKAYSYVITRTWTGADLCNNIAVRTQTITVQDTQPPYWTSTPPAFITVQCDEDADNNENPIAEDECDGNPSVLKNLKYIPIPGACVNNYKVEYTWTAGDKCGNIIKFVQVITVIDNESPVIKCPLDIELSSDVPVAVTWPAAQGSDLCDGQLLTTQIAGPPSGSLFLPGSQTAITYIVSDGCGNSASCTFYVKINKNSSKISPPKQLGQSENNQLDLIGKNNTDEATILFQNEPNPFQNSTFVRFSLPAAEFARLTIIDINGKLIKSIEGEFIKGENKIELSDGDFPSSGMYFYNLRTYNFNNTKKMVFTKQ